MGSDDAFLAADDPAQAAAAELPTDKPGWLKTAEREGWDLARSAEAMFEATPAEPVSPGRIVRFRPAGTEDVWLPALVLTVPGELSKTDALVTGAWNWPDPPLEGCVHLAVFQPHADRQVELEVNVPEGEGERNWRWPGRS